MRDIPAVVIIQGGSNITGTNCDLFTYIVPVIFEPHCGDALERHSSAVCIVLKVLKGPKII